MDVIFILGRDYILHSWQIYPALCAFDFFTTLLVMEPGRIPNKLKFFRRISGFSQKKVARLLGLIETNSISRWEHGYTVPKIKNLFKLAQLYHALPHELYPNLWEKSAFTEKSSVPEEPITNHYPFTMP